MRHNMFPFENVKKGSKIILYGMGYAGRQYAAQVEGGGIVKYFLDWICMRICFR